MNRLYIMKKVVKYTAGGLLFLFLGISLSACSEDGGNPNNPDEKSQLYLSIDSRNGSDKLVKGNDDKFSSIAIYIFNEEDGYCEYSEIITGLHNETALSRSVSVSNKTKLVYAIANFDDVQKQFTGGTISKNTTREELDRIIVSNGIFLNDKIMMVRKKRVEITSSYITVDMPMQRLAARMDFFLSKSLESADTEIELKSITVKNLVFNSVCKYNTKDMPDIIDKGQVRADFSGTELVLLPDNPEYLSPQNALASFYSYQYQADVTEPDVNSTPYIIIELLVDDIPATYTAFLTDDSQTKNKYTIQQNTVYKIIGQFVGEDNKLDICVTALPWDVTGSEIGYEVCDDDYSFDIFSAGDNDSECAVIHYPHKRPGGRPVNSSSHVGYNFSFTGPVGAVWTATLTNGLGFEFTQEGVVPGTKAYSRGIARQEPYEIRIKASKPWIGQERHTWLYITSGGEKLKINPELPGGGRKFPGNSDTGILITQTEHN